MDTSVLVVIRRVPRASRLYWVCQAAGWTGFLTYVVAGYWIFARKRCWEDLASIVVFCVVIPPLMTHGLRAWMYRHEWTRLAAWPRWLRLLGAALLMGGVATSLIGLAVGISTGRVWAPTEGMGWTLLAYVIAFGCWLLIYDIIHERRRRDELEIVAREAQLRALRAQLNPHFMFNCLNSLRNAIIEQPARAVSMVTGLADILRYSLASAQQDTVTLAEEMKVVDEYLELERARFEERLRVERLVEVSALAVRVPPMLVQTLVENAVKHGVAASTEGGEIVVEARVRGNRAEIRVSNSARVVAPIASGGQGLRNAVERLRLIYGSLASLTVSGTGDRFVASLVLPMEPTA